MESSLTADQLEAIRTVGTCAVANAIETFNVRLRNEGFTDRSIRSVFENPQPVLGYAVTGTIRTCSPPAVGRQGSAFRDRTDWWDYILSIPAPRIIVLQDVDPTPGCGSFWGEVHANIHKALGCEAVVTNGAVRDLAEIQATGMRFFAGNISVSHAYVHFVEFGKPVDIAGLRISPGDLLHGDRNGVLSIPAGVAPRIPAVVASLHSHKRRIIDFCHSPDFSIAGLKDLVKQTVRTTPDLSHIGAGIVDEEPTTRHDKKR